MSQPAERAGPGGGLQEREVDAPDALTPGDIAGRSLRSPARVSSPREPTEALYSPSGGTDGEPGRGDGSPTADARPVIGRGFDRRAAPPKWRERKIDGGPTPTAPPGPGLSRRRDHGLIGQRPRAPLG